MSLQGLGCTGNKENSQPQKAVYPQILFREKGTPPGCLQGVQVNGQGCPTAPCKAPTILQLSPNVVLGAASFLG